MADWKQIAARIRRARGSKNPVEQLSNLFQKTSDAMVAFELASHLESAGQSTEAAKWYATAAERFRRASWKTKALEAAARLGGAVPTASEISQQTSGEADFQLTSPIPAPLPEPALPFQQNSEALEAVAAVASEEAAAPLQPPVTPPATQVEPRRHGRRGHRGGRNRHKHGRTGPPTAQPGVQVTSELSPGIESSRQPDQLSTEHESGRPRPIPAPSTELAEETLPAPKGRFGDPGLSSRISLLEMQFRRLLSCPPVKLDHADRAPAGPGVFVLTDEDMTTYYYAEACDTLRVAIANVARGGVGRRGAPSIKPLLAEHLGISESRVAKYLTDHCVVRWLQLDEGATHFAHFAIAVLRPVLND
jgi:hypothetical protein